MRRYFLALVLLFYTATLAANDDKHIKDALLKYNYGIIKMGKSGEFDFFKNFVAQDVAIKLQVWFESWKFSNLTYIAQINDLRFSPIAYNEDNATIRTLENWTFSYVDLRTKEFALEPTNIFYKMKYTLKNHHGNWIIVAVEKLEEETFIKPNMHEPSLESKEAPPSDTPAQNSKGKIETH